MLALPYGLADFPRIIKSGYEYVDRTSHIHDVEALGSHLLFIRPRRFGKSLWLRTLAAYYDLRTASEHEELFGHLAVGRNPTSGAHRYFVLQWDFSEVSPRGSVDQIAESLSSYVNTELETFLSDYRDHLPRVETRADARNTLLAVLAAIRQTQYPLYLLIDEYDNFANEVMVRDGTAFSGLVHGAGPYKELMKTVKRATQGLGLERLFVTGVSPVVMSDLSSGMNILTDVYQRPELAALCGFKDDEIVNLLERIWADAENPSWTVEQAGRTIRDWYNGYRFSPEAREQVFNPTMTIYFLDHLQRYGESPRSCSTRTSPPTRTSCASSARSSGLKMAFHVLLFNDISYLVFSEPELGRGYADLCLLRRFDRPSPALFDLLFEFKFLKLAGLGKTGEEIRRTGKEELAELDAVKEAFDEAEAQLFRYRHALSKRFGKALRLRAFAVVGLGFDRILAREAL